MSEQALLEQLFGYQTPNTGYVDNADNIGKVDPNYTYNPLPYKSYKSFMGDAYTLQLGSPNINPMTRSYYGELPLAEQPKPIVPEPYTRQIGY